VPTPNVLWATDFRYDSTTDGRPIKILSAVDEHTRECFGSLVERSITAARLVNELDDIVADRGVAPRVLRLDNGPEMIAAALAEWAGNAYGDDVYSAGRAVAQSFHRIVQWSATR
jgi:putative transposase